MINTLEKGDLIGVAYNNYIHPAIYVGEGSGNNPHFYRLNVNYIESLQKGVIPYVDFINRQGKINSHGCTPIVKVSVGCLSETQQSIYTALKDLLIKNGKI